MKTSQRDKFFVYLKAGWPLDALSGEKKNMRCLDNGLLVKHGSPRPASCNVKKKNNQPDAIYVTHRSTTTATQKGLTTIFSAPKALNAHVSQSRPPAAWALYNQLSTRS